MSAQDTTCRQIDIAAGIAHYTSFGDRLFEKSGCGIRAYFQAIEPGSDCEAELATRAGALLEHGSLAAIAVRRALLINVIDVHQNVLHRQTLMAYVSSQIECHLRGCQENLILCMNSHPQQDFTL